MGFWDVFVKVWQVRASIRIQNSIENGFRNSRTSRNYDNTEEIVSALIKSNDSWQSQLNYHRQQSFNQVIKLSCEFCGTKFNAVEIVNQKKIFSGVAYFDNNPHAISDDVIVEITDRLKDESGNFIPFLYCSKKCMVSDTSRIGDDLKK